MAKIYVVNGLGSENILHQEHYTSLHLYDQEVFKLEAEAAEYAKAEARKTMEIYKPAYFKDASLILDDDNKDYSIRTSQYMYYAKYEIREFDI